MSFAVDPKQIQKKKALVKKMLTNKKFISMKSKLVKQSDKNLEKFRTRKLRELRSKESNLLRVESGVSS